MALQSGTRTKLNEWITWFNWHADKVATYPLERKQEWTLKAINGLYECMAELAREADGPKRMDNRILLPKGYQWEGRRGA